MQECIEELLKLEEIRNKAMQTFSNYQKIIKRWFDSHLVSNKDFDIGDLVLKWDKCHENKGKHTKFQKLWLSPFQISRKVGPLLTCCNHWRVR